MIKMLGRVREILNLDASSISVADASPVSIWADSSGHGYDGTQSIANKKPTYYSNVQNGAPGVQFNTDQLLISGPVLPTKTTIMITIKRGPGQTWQYWFASNGASSFPAFFTGFQGEVFGFYNTSNNIFKNFVDGVNVLTIVQNDGISLTAYANGVLDFTAPPTSIGGKSLTSIGSLLNGNVDVRAGYICDLKIFPALLSDTERSRFENKLMTKYGITPITLTNDQLVCDGDSLTYGTGTVENGYVDQIKALLPTLTVRNLGVSGISLTNMFAKQSVHVLPLYSATRTRNILVIWGGVNDLNTIASGAALYDILLNYTQAAQAAGYLVVNCTITPATSITGESETRRTDFNTLVNTNSANANAVVDLASDVRLDDATDATYYFDGLHMKTTGYAVVSELIAATVGIL